MSIKSLGNTVTEILQNWQEYRTGGGTAIVCGRSIIPRSLDFFFHPYNGLCVAVPFGKQRMAHYHPVTDEEHKRIKEDIYFGNFEIVIESPKGLSESGRSDFREVLHQATGKRLNKKEGA